MPFQQGRRRLTPGGYPQGYVEEREELRTTLEGMFVIQLL